MYALEFEAWGRFFASIGQSGECPLVSVSLMCESEDREESDRTGLAWPLRSISYDRERDVLLVAAGGTDRQPALRYFISHPRRILIDESALERMIVVDDRKSTRVAITVRAGSGWPYARSVLDLAS